MSTFTVSEAGWYRYDARDGWRKVEPDEEGAVLLTNGGTVQEITFDSETITVEWNG